MMWRMAGTPTTDAARKRLGEMIEARRGQLQLSKEKAAELAGVSAKTWKTVERGRGAWDTTYAKMEAVLHWEHGSIRSILAGGMPTLLDGGPVALKRGPQSSQWSPDITDRMRNALRDAVITAAPEVTGAKIQEIQRRFEEDLRSDGILPPLDEPDPGGDTAGAPTTHDSAT